MIIYRHEYSLLIVINKLINQKLLKWQLLKKTIQQTTAKQITVATAGRTAATIQTILLTWMTVSNRKLQVKAEKPHTAVEIQPENINLIKPFVFIQKSRQIISPGFSVFLGIDKRF